MTKIHKLTKRIINHEDLDIGSCKTLKMIDDHATKMNSALILARVLINELLPDDKATLAVIDDALKN